MLNKKTMAANSRRIFLKQSTLATIGLTILKPFDVLCESFRKQNNPPAWADLIEYARWCPTVHNLQPHKIKIMTDTEAALYYSPKKLLPIGDPNSVFVTVALGIFHEHLSLAAAFYGYDVIMTNIPSPIKTQKDKDNKYFATLKLIPSMKKENLHRDLMLKRKTSRKHYNGEALKAGTLAQLKDEAEHFGHDFFSTSDPQLIDEVIKLNQQILFHDISIDADRKELDALFAIHEKKLKRTKMVCGQSVWAFRVCL